jgi:dihydropteroate synthase
MTGIWRIGGNQAIHTRSAVIMAILNLTPDSFSDGGRLPTPDDALRAAAQALEDGALILDLGGESTRPGSAPVPAEEQIRRVVPAVSAVARALPEAILSVDTTLAPVARAAIDAGAVIINDVSGGTHDPEMLPLAARARVGLVLMHRRTEPRLDRYADAYERSPIEGDIVIHVRGALQERLHAARAAGIDPEAVVLDPGLGFGKTVEQNLDLIGRTGDLTALGRPVLSGLSRKSFVGRASLGRDSQPSERLAGTLSLSAAHRQAGASIFRVHDVGPHEQALRAIDAVLGLGR